MLAKNNAMAVSVAVIVVQASLAGEALSFVSWTLPLLGHLLPPLDQ